MTSTVELAGCGTMSHRLGDVRPAVPQIDAFVRYLSGALRSYERLQ